MKVVGNIIKLLFVMLAITIAYFALHIFLGRVMFKNEYPTIFGYGYTSVEEKTVDDIYKLGDIIIFKQQDSYDVGDYIIYKKLDKQVIELVKDKTENGYVTLTNDKYDLVEIHESFVKGKVHSSLKMGNFSAFITSGIGIFFVLGIFIYFTFTTNRS